MKLSVLFTRVGLVEVHEEWWHDEEECVGDRVEELCDEGAEGVVLLAPVHRRAPPQKVVPQHHHFGGLAPPLPPPLCKQGKLVIN